MYRQALFILAALLVSASVMTVQAAEPMKSSPLGEALIPNNDKMFMEHAASAGMYEVAAGKLALERGGSPEVKKFGQMMVSDHTKANEELMALAAMKKVQLPTELMNRHQMMLDELRDEESAEDFDEAFKREMVASHKEAVTLFTNAAKNSKDPEVKAFASKTLPKLQQHGGMAKELPKSGK